VPRFDSRISRRAFIASAAGVATFAAKAAEPSTTLASDVASLLMVGFAGSSPYSPSAIRLARYIRHGHVGSVFFVQDNVGFNRDLQELVAGFKAARPGLRLAIDHEGGLVQRLTPTHGCRRVPKAFDIPGRMSPSEALDFYAQVGKEFAATGFNINLAPVVDIYAPGNPAIAKFGRAFSSDPEIIVAYARAFIDGFHASRIVCALKHFPGYGNATEDNHDELPDITKTWSARDLEPYSALIGSNRVNLIMGTHLKLASLDPNMPTTLSRRITAGLLREELRFQGVIMTDDIDMAALAKSMDRKSAFIAALAAGNDLIMVKNVTNHDPNFPLHAVQWVEEAIASGKLSREAIAASARRVEALSIVV
jgi:beta-N-acetylhexosaminidase